MHIKLLSVFKKISIRFSSDAIAATENFPPIKILFFHHTGWPKSMFYCLD